MMLSQVAVIFRRLLLEQLAAHGYGDVLVIESRQPTKQGRIDDGIYYRLIEPKNHGWQARRYDYVDGNGHTETQLYQVKMQLGCLIHDDDRTGYSSDDLASITQMLINNLSFVEKLKRAGVGIQRASAIRNIDFTDEADNYAIESQFDVNLTFTRSINPNTPQLRVLTPQLMRV